MYRIVFVNLMCNIKRLWKVLTIGGGTNDGACVSTHALGGFAGILPQKNF